MIVPMEDRVLIKPKTIETKTASGIFLAVDDKKEAASSREGIVTAVGETAWKDFAVKPEIGDNVNFVRYAGASVTDSDGTEYFLMSDQDVIAILRK